MIYPEVFSFAQSSLYYAFKNSDGMGQGIVILLFVFSVFTWTLMLEKGISLRRAHNDCASFLRRFRERRNPLSMNEGIADEPSPSARVCEAAYERIKTLNIELPGEIGRAHV